jgi:hypothetical protein
VRAWQDELNELLAHGIGLLNLRPPHAKPHLSDFLEVVARGLLDLDERLRSIEDAPNTAVPLNGPR